MLTTIDPSNEYFDCVAVLQAVQHTEDWRETGKELLRVMKRSRTILLAEITFKNINEYAALDLHLEYWLEKMFTRVGIPRHEFPYYSPKELLQAIFRNGDRCEGLRLERA